MNLKYALIFFMLIPAVVVKAAEVIKESLMDCAAIVSDTQRLQCFDTLVGRMNVEHSQSYVRVSDKFLNSELRVDAAKSDFNLTVQKFFQLIKQARMENNRPIDINGWLKVDSGYVLEIKMRELLQVAFDYREKDKYSVLKPVLYGATKVDPAIFIMNIAAMSPD